MDKEKLFSREALNKLRSPEKLNTLIPVTNPIAWVGLIARREFKGRVVVDFCHVVKENVGSRTVEGNVMSCAEQIPRFFGLHQVKTKKPPAVKFKRRRDEFGQFFLPSVFGHLLNGLMIIFCDKFLNGFTFTFSEANKH